MMFRTTAAFAAICLGLGLAPVSALSLHLGASVNAGGSASAGGASASGGAAAATDLSLGVTTKGILNLTGAATDDSMGDVATATSTSGSAAADANLQLSGVINLIQSSDWTSSSLSNVTFSSASVTDAGAFVDSTNSAAFTSVVDANATDIAELHAAIAANAALSAWLASENVDASSVVALDLAADGTVELFTD